MGKACQMVWVVAAVITKEDRICITRRKSGLRHAGMWEFPGGKVKTNESPEDALMREIREELNIEITITRLLARCAHDYREGPITLWAYEATWDRGEMMLKDHDEIAWILPGDYSQYELLPADVPVAIQLLNEINNDGV